MQSQLGSPFELAPKQLTEFVGEPSDEFERTIDLSAEPPATNTFPANLDGVLTGYDPYGLLPKLPRPRRFKLRRWGDLFK
jgi:hypothetical protein